MWSVCVCVCVEHDWDLQCKTSANPNRWNTELAWYYDIHCKEGCKHPDTHPVHNHEAAELKFQALCHKVTCRIKCMCGVQ